MKKQIQRLFLALWLLCGAQILSSRRPGRALRWACLIHTRLSIYKPEQLKSLALRKLLSHTRETRTGLCRSTCLRAEEGRRGVLAVGGHPVGKGDVVVEALVGLAWAGRTGGLGTRTTPLPCIIYARAHITTNLRSPRARQHLRTPCPRPWLRSQRRPIAAQNRKKGVEPAGESPQTVAPFFVFQPTFFGPPWSACSVLHVSADPPGLRAQKERI